LQIGHFIGEFWCPSPIDSIVSLLSGQGGRAWSVFAKTQPVNTHPRFMGHCSGRLTARSWQSMP
jgi:hypothetical protein